MEGWRWGFFSGYLCGFWIKEESKHEVKHESHTAAERRDVPGVQKWGSSLDSNVGFPRGLGSFPSACLTSVSVLTCRGKESLDPEVPHKLDNQG